MLGKKAPEGGPGGLKSLGYFRSRIPLETRQPRFGTNNAMTDLDFDQMLLPKQTKFSCFVGNF